MTELTQIIKKGTSYYNQIINAQTELYHSMELGADDQGNTDICCLGEWWLFCLEEYKKGYYELSFTLADFKPYLQEHKFEYVTEEEDLEYLIGEEDSDLLTVEECLEEEELLIAKKAFDNLCNLLSDLTPVDDLVNKINFELMYLE